jgi:hypothetical protein
MSSKNEITGDSITSKKNNDLYRDNWEKIFGKNKIKPSTEDSEPKNLPASTSVDSVDISTDTEKTKEQP